MIDEAKAWLDQALADIQRMDQAKRILDAILEQVDIEELLALVDEQTRTMILEYYEVQRCQQSG